SGRPEAGRLQVDETGLPDGNRFCGITILIESHGDGASVVGIADVEGNRRIQCEGIVRWIHRRQLINLPLRSQVGSLAADVGQSSHYVLWHLALHTETPLLDIRPDRLSGNRRQIQRVSGVPGSTWVSAARHHPLAADAGVGEWPVLSHVDDQW